MLVPIHDCMHILAAGLRYNDKWRQFSSWKTRRGGTEDDIITVSVPVEPQLVKNSAQHYQNSDPYKQLKLDKVSVIDVNW